MVAVTLWRTAAHR